MNLYICIENNCDAKENRFKQKDIFIYNKNRFRNSLRAILNNSETDDLNLDCQILTEE